MPMVRCHEQILEFFRDILKLSALIGCTSHMTSFNQSEKTSHLNLKFS